jgi:arginase
VRDYEKPEEYLMIRHKIENITVPKARELTVDGVFDRVQKRLVECDKIYISFDVDSMDPSISRGTGTPVPGGFKVDEVEEIILRLLDDPRLCCLEFTEVNPVLDDKGNAMAETAFRILKAVHDKLESLGK